MLPLLYNADNWWVLPLWLAVLGGVWWRWQQQQTPTTRRFLGLAIAIKGLALAVYLLYSSAGTGGGDLVFFWNRLAPRYWQLILEHPEWRSELLGFLLWNSPEQNAALQNAFSGQLFNRFNYTNGFELLYLRLVLLIRLASGGNLAAGLLLSTGLGFLGQWWVFRALRRFGSGNTWLRFLVAFGLPSVGIYTSAYHKETFILFGFGAMALGLWGARRTAGRVVLVGFGWLLMFAIKPYLALIMLPFLAMTGLWGLLKHQTLRVKRLTLGGIAVVVIGSAILLWDKLLYVIGYGRYLRQLVLDKGDAHGNKVDIGAYDLTLPELVFASLKALAATLFAPLPGHIQNHWGWAMVLDNLVWVSLSVWMLYTLAHKRLNLRWQPAHWLLIVWPIIYSMVLGLSVPYFGTLLRYRTLAVLLLVSGIYVFYASAYQKRERL